MALPKFIKIINFFKAVSFALNITFSINVQHYQENIAYVQVKIIARMLFLVYFWLFGKIMYSAFINLVSQRSYFILGGFSFGVVLRIGKLCFTRRWQ